MSEEPNLPPLPSIGDVMTRKDDLKEYKTTVIECTECHRKTTRDFTDGDYVHKKVDVTCKGCSKKDSIIISIHAEWDKPKNHRKKKEESAGH